MVFSSGVTFLSHCGAYFGHPRCTLLLCLRVIYKIDHVLFIDMGASYKSVFTLWQLIELYTYDVCTFLYAYFNKKLKNLKNKYEEPV